MENMDKNTLQTWNLSFVRTTELHLSQAWNVPFSAAFSPAPLFNCLILSTNFGQPKTWPVCRFRYCFLDICSYKNHSAETWGLGCLFLDYSQPWYLCGLLPTDHPLRPGSHQWTHSTALSLFRWPEHLILAKMNRWVFFFESHAMLAHQTNRSHF